MLARGEIEKVEPVDGQLAVHLKDSLLGDGAVVQGDLVVLATGMVPNGADGEKIRALTDARFRVETVDEVVHYILDGWLWKMDGSNPDFNLALGQSI